MAGIGGLSDLASQQNSNTIRNDNRVAATNQAVQNYQIQNQIENSETSAVETSAAQAQSTAQKATASGETISKGWSQAIAQAA